MPKEAEIDKNEQGSTEHFFFWVAVGFVVVAIYVLSTGPVIKFLEVPGRSPSSTVLVIYAPLVWLSEQNHRFNSFMDWYVKEVWRVDK